MAHSDSAQHGAREIGRRTLRRLTGYYVVAGAALYGLTRLVVALPPAMGGSKGPFPGWADAAFQMLSALLLVLPVALVYVRTRTRQKYDQSLVQTVIVLPITVAAILIVVQNSLALAFSLAGIVAAVRFRNNLRESRDAVYIFGALGIGFATGVHQTGIALALSLLFCIVELALWKFDIGADHEETFAKLCGHEAPPAVHGNTAAEGAGAGSAGGNSDETEAKGVGRDHRVRIFVRDAGVGRRVVEPVLDDVVKRWEFVAAGEEDSRRFLDYQVHLRKKAAAADLGAQLETRGRGEVVGFTVEPVVDTAVSTP